MAILCVGSVALDSVATPAGERQDALGGSATFFSTAASFLAPVDLVAVVGEDFPEAHVQFLRSRGVGLSGLERQPGRTFRWRGSYGWDLNEAKTLATELNVFEQFRPRVPEALRRPDILFLGNIEPELQGSVLSQVERPKLVAADTMNFWIQGRREALLRTLAKVDLLFVNDTEARQLAGETNIVKAVKAIQRMGPRLVCVKRGEYGALLFQPPDAGELGFCAVPALPLEEVRDPTGAGDSFAGGFLGALAAEGSLGAAAFLRALVMGSVLASLAVEDFSLDRFRTLRPEELVLRRRLFERLMFVGEEPRARPS
ncbi:MAG: PfkB family carbohydrate kinase [Deltaproteobacteria bacterium]